MRFLACFTDYTFLRCSGGSCAFHDICHWTTYHLCWLWTGKLHPLIEILRSSDELTFPPLGPYRPIVQTYTDLRQLRVSNVVQAILGD